MTVMSLLLQGDYPAMEADDCTAIGLMGNCGARECAKYAHGKCPRPQDLIEGEDDPEVIALHCQIYGGGGNGL
jgi:hypothetical protein